MGPLDGIKVIELPNIGPVQFAGMLLSDLGAEVLRVDRASDVASGRSVAGGNASAFSVIDRGRRSVGVDLKHPGGAAGVLWHLGPDGHAPVPPINLLADFGGGGSLVVNGILAALIERGRSGSGQVVDAAMVDGSAQLMSIFWGLDAMGGWGPRGTNLLDGGAHFYNVYETADGGYVSVAAYEPQFYANFLRLVGPL